MMISSILKIEAMRATSLIKYALNADVWGIYNIESGKQMARCEILEATRSSRSALSSKNILSSDFG